MWWVGEVSSPLHSRSNGTSLAPLKNFSSKKKTRNRSVCVVRASNVPLEEERELSAVLVRSISNIGESTWNACHDGSNPFLTFNFLNALEVSGSACAKTGWLPQHLLVEKAPLKGDNGTPIACCPMYLKAHSYGEYVFDSGWAQSYDMNVLKGPRYYPKLQSAIPFTPATGQRILVNPSVGVEKRQSYFDSTVNALKSIPNTMGVSGLHVTFNTKEESDQLAAHGFLTRVGVQYHWENGLYWHEEKYASFDDFLSVLKQKKRKSIRQERKRVAHEVHIEQLTGEDLKDPELWDSFYDFYQNTVDQKWGVTYLTRSFFDIISETMADKILLVVAREKKPAGKPVAAALNFIGEDTLFGRNWGCLPGLNINSLHFELCYYQAIDFAIQHGLARVEAGAQGEHKVQRGYLPTLTYSNHIIRDAQFSVALEDFVRREAREIEAYSEALCAYESPFKQ